MTFTNCEAIFIASKNYLMINPLNASAALI